MIENLQYPQMEVSAFQEPKAGQTDCGDSYFVTETDDYFLCALADGLGSGKGARRSSELAISIIKEHHHKDIGTLMKASNEALSSERGAVLSMFKIMFAKRELLFSGVGNVRLALFQANQKTVHPIPASGFMSGRRQSYRLQSFSFEEDSSFILYSDGLAMNTGSNGVFSNRISAEEASRRAQKMAYEDRHIQDDVTFIFGKRR